MLARAQRALADFFRLEAAGGIVLIVAAALALAFANSPWQGAYEAFRHFELGKPVEWWINDVLMAVFFLVVALEIKREALSGQLSNRAQLLLPLLCAAAGVIVPALIFIACNRGDAAALRGWAVPTATDIAFALGVLALLGSRVPTGMKLLLSTIAVADDLIAILIIAVFYTHELNWPFLFGALLLVVAMAWLSRRGTTALAPYLLLGILLWWFVLQSGVHPTVAGVATGLMIPHVDPRNAIDDEIESSPLEKLEHALHPWVAYAILPLFAFANAGLDLGNIGLRDALAPWPLGIALGLVLGKPIGIVAAALALRAAGVARFPDGMGLRAMLGLGMLCGIGFTMSLFIAGLAYGSRGYDDAVLGVLLASIVSAIAGLLWLRATLPAGKVA